METLSLIVLLVVWVAASCGTGFLLALLGKRLHPGLSLVRLWFFYTVLMGMFVAIIFLVAWF